MPVLEAIHSSFVSTSLAKSSLLTIVFGAQEPTPINFIPTRPLLLLLLLLACTHLLGSDLTEPREA